MASASPFDNLDPVVRNEEDEIRKGIFSHALRKLHGLPLTERQQWCAAIRESTMPKVLKNPAGSGPHAGEKRPRPETDSPAQAEPIHVADTAETAAAIPVDEDQPQTVEEATEVVSAYMRTLLDKVVGGSLNDLGVPALRVLCLMVGITTQVKSKVALYNMLASFYFTQCAKLGKRESTSRQADLEVQRAAVMLQMGGSGAGAKTKTGSHAHAHAAATATAAAVAAAPPPAHPKAKARNGTERAEATTTTPTNSRARPPVADPGRTALHTAAVAKSSARAAPTAPAPATCYTDVYHPAPDSDDDDNGGEGERRPGHHRGGGATELRVALNTRVFSKPPVQQQQQQQQCPPSGGFGSGWGQQELDRRIASIVQLYDPVTVATVVRKLAQMGFRADNAADVVEDTLCRFHRQHHIFYESGIAYMM